MPTCRSRNGPTSTRTPSTCARRPTPSRGCSAARLTKGMTVTSQALKCSHCRRRYRQGSTDAHLWNATMKAGVRTGVLCPACQTPDENAEAVINEATLDYGVDGLGRAAAQAKTDGD